MSPQQLPQLTPLLHDELPISFVARLAWTNGFRTLGEFCRIVNLRVSDLFTLSEPMVRRISDMSEVAPTELARFRKSSEPLTDFGQSTVRTKQVLPFNRIRVCLRCLTVDSLSVSSPVSTPPYIRAPWQWSLISSCGIHKCSLTHLQHSLIDLPEFQHRSDSQDRKSPARSNASDDYLYRRLTEPAGSNYLDQMPAYVAAEFCILLGRIAANSAPKHLLWAQSHTSLRLGESGFAIASRGPEAISEFLLNIAARPNGSHYLRPIFKWATTHNEKAHYTPALELLQQQAIKLSG